mmetsp:Transcript_5900/g.10538  ORF Transcript_5900/g.10538 Transcript_5900/m.10538 type:complete len:257 (-) Transcript_5900:29-799(-)
MGVDELIEYGAGSSDALGVEVKQHSVSQGDCELLNNLPGIDEQARKLFVRHFPDNEEAIAKALDGMRAVTSQTFREGQLNLFGCRGSEDHGHDLMSACIIQIRKIPIFGSCVMEILWFASETAGRGWGSKLFNGLLRISERLGVDAVLSTSTNSAMPFWLSRPNVRIASSVLRARSRGQVDIREKFCFKAWPCSSAMGKLYSEQPLRNRKGKVIGNFQGRPYYYSIETSNHVWFLLNPKLTVPSIIHSKPPTTGSS